MIAEIHGKISKYGSNLSDRSEDQLTGDFFGCMRYIPFKYGIKQILQQCVYPESLLKCLNKIKINEWHEYIHFWRKNRSSISETEPDVVIAIDDVVILIEVKYLGGLSSDENPDALEDYISTMKTEIVESKNQIGRESRFLTKKYPEIANKFVLLLAPESSAANIYHNIQNRIENGEAIIDDGVKFGYITWQKVLSALKSISLVDAFQCLIVQDMTDLLTKKGFDSFNNFIETEMPLIDSKDIWPFTYVYIPNIQFSYIKRIEEDLYYEFK